MTSREFSALLSAILVFAGSAWYVLVAIKGDKVKPVFAGWIVFGVTAVLSFVTYWTSPKHSLVSNACHITAVICTLVITVVVSGLHLKSGSVVRFSVFQKWCLWISGLITVIWVIIVWGFNGTGIVPNIFTQALLIVGYAVTAEKLWHATKNTESFFTWSCSGLGSAIALYTGIVSGDPLVIVFAIRSTITSGTLVWLMYRIERRNP